MIFELPEYDRAYAEFLFGVIHELARSRDPVLAEMTFESVPSTVGSRVQSRDGLNVELEPGKAGFTLVTKDDALRSFDLEEFVVGVDKAADELAKDLMKIWLSSMDSVTKGTGQVVDAKGGEFTFDLFYEMLDSIEWPDVAEDGSQVLPSIVTGPDMIEKFKQLPPLTAEQQQRMDELKERKHRESLARRRSRRLS